jgi:hypothetical protein
MDHPVEKLGTVDALIDRFGKARSRRANWEDMWRDAYDYTMPAKNLWVERTKGNFRRRKIFDSTAVNGVPTFATRIMAALTPSWTNWAKLELGAAVDDDAELGLDPSQWPDYAGMTALEAVEEIGETLFHYLHHSNFASQAFEAYQDLAVSTASIHMDWRDGGFVFTAVPLSELFLEEGPNGSVETQWRKLKVPARNIAQTWLGAEVAGELAGLVERAPDTEVDIIEGVVHVPPKRPGDDPEYWLVVMDETRKTMLLASPHGESSPYITAPWSRTPGEIYGRGPVISALADIMTANKMMEHKLIGDAFAVMGLWTGVDDGVWNPHTARLKPGTILPVASNDGTNPSIRPLPLGGAPQIVDVDLEALRRNIEKQLFSNPLGDIQDAPVRTLGENMMRMRDVLEKAGASFSLLEWEWAAKIVKRGAFLLAREGIIPPLRIDGQDVAIKFSSPLAQARDAQELTSIVQYAQTMGAVAPMEAPFAFKTEEVSDYVREKTGLPERLFRTQEEIQEAMAQMAAMQGGAGGQQQPV